jgi:hypothetical protein
MDTSKNQKSEATFKITGDWKEQSKKLKSKHPQLTDEDLKFEAGKENDLIRRLESKLKKNRQEVINIIKESKMAISL